LYFGTKWRTNSILFPGMETTRVCRKNMDHISQKLSGVGRKRTDDKKKKSQVLEQWVLFENLAG